MGLFDMLSSIATMAMEKNDETNQKENINPDSSDELEFKTWDSRWESIGKLKDANLSNYNHCIGLYRHKIDGQIKYIGKATEYNNGGFRKRLSDYRRKSCSATNYSSGKKIRNNIDKIYTDILIVGNDREAVKLTNKLEDIFIENYNPEWNKMKK